jgi:hypothetical protein
MERTLAGVVGFFEDPQALTKAVVRVREAGYESFDSYTPYPVHGLEHAQGLKRSPLPWVTFFAGLTGFAAAFGLQYWTSVMDWPVNIGGKPLNSWPAFVPILFELTVLFASLATVGAMFLLNGLPNTNRRAFDPNITRDRFALMIDAPKPRGEDDEEVQASAEAAQKQFSESEASTFLKSLGAKEVRSVYAEGWF